MLPVQLQKFQNTFFLLCFSPIFQNMKHEVSYVAILTTLFHISRNWIFFSTPKGVFPSGSGGINYWLCANKSNKLVWLVTMLKRLVTTPTRYKHWNKTSRSETPTFLRLVQTNIWLFSFNPSENLYAISLSMLVWPSLTLTPQTCSGQKRPPTWSFSATLWPLTHRRLLNSQCTRPQGYRLKCGTLFFSLMFHYRYICLFQQEKLAGGKVGCHSPQEVGSSSIPEPHSGCSLWLTDVFHKMRSHFLRLSSRTTSTQPACHSKTPFHGPELRVSYLSQLPVYGTTKRCLH